jgi:hypothetical protein
MELRAAVGAYDEIAAQNCRRSALPKTRCA